MSAGKRVGIERAASTDERGDNGPKIVIGPAETNNNEELPLIPSHSNFLDLPSINT